MNLACPRILFPLILGKCRSIRKVRWSNTGDGIRYGFEKLNVEIVYGTAVLRRDRTVEVELKGRRPRILPRKCCHYSYRRSALHEPDSRRGP